MFHTFRYSGGVMTDLNSLLSPGSGWTILNAQGINDLGQIAATGVDSLGRTHALLLEPEAAAVPEPSTLAMGGIAALVGLGCAWRRRGRAAVMALR